jgi:hypothetical protein
MHVMCKSSLLRTCNAQLLPNSKATESENQKRVVRQAKFVLYQTMWQALFADDEPSARANRRWWSVGDSSPRSPAFIGHSALCGIRNLGIRAMPIVSSFHKRFPRTPGPERSQGDASKRRKHNPTSYYRSFQDVRMKDREVRTLHTSRAPGSTSSQTAQQAYYKSVHLESPQKGTCGLHGPQATQARLVRDSTLALPFRSRALDNDASPVTRRLDGQINDNHRHLFAAGLVACCQV